MKILKFSKYNIKNLTFIFFVVIALFSNVTTVNAQKKYKIVLDAGHGGKDPGNLGNGYREKKIALRVALDVGKELLTSKDIEVIYTRKKDVFVELHKRAKIANEQKADLFVSIHCDSYVKSRAHGAGTFVLGLKGNSGNLEMAKRENAVILLEDNYEQNYDYDPNSPESLIGLSVLQEENLDNSLLIAGLIQTNFSNLKRFDRKVKQDNFLVLRETIMPSVLVELGFLTNKAEGRFLNTRKGQIKMAKAIAKAIRKYVHQLKINTVGGSYEEVYVKETPKKETKKKPQSTEISKKAKPNKAKIKRPKVEIAKVKKSTTKKTGIEFKVQIAASRNFLTNDNFNFKGLENVESMYVDGYYKYYYGNTSVFQRIKKTLKKVRKAGHKDAFVVAFKDGVKISIKEALKSR
ncbi:N-acetylmuramoyl-L-alanine amidase [Tenacibaculum sp. 190524A02b]|uniref:N-acetylmuramoyl-L-alanine amidase family protein n=1 Tax=Tenacibaculum vairaonense TaxID=3137860 RepID=UPI0032B20FE9